jgi:hypothetical protein
MLKLINAFGAVSLSHQGSQLQLHIRFGGGRQVENEQKYHWPHFKCNEGPH